MRTKRILEIEKYILQKGNATLDEICLEFGVSKSTLRRYLEEITEKGVIKKTYGGVTAEQRAPLLSFSARNATGAEAKRKIAALAADQVEDGDVIFVDSGTTTLYMADALADFNNLTVLTNSLEVIVRLLPYENVTVISLSGELNRETVSFTGQSAADVLGVYNIGKAFLACTGVSVAGGVSNSSEAERMVKQTAVSKSQSVYLLADSRKFEVISLITYCGIDKIDTLISDKDPPQELMQELETCGTKLLIADDE